MCEGKKHASSSGDGKHIVHLKGCYKGVTRVLQGSYMLRGCYKGISWCDKGVTRV
jgi:uncharacterized protein YraI